MLGGTALLILLPHCSGKHYKSFAAPAMVPSKCPFIGKQVVVIFLQLVVIMEAAKPVKTPSILAFSANNSKKRSTCHDTFFGKVVFFFNLLDEFRASLIT